MAPPEPRPRNHRGIHSVRSASPACSALFLAAATARSEMSLPNVRSGRKAVAEGKAQSATRHTLRRRGLAKTRTRNGVAHRRGARARARAIRAEWSPRHKTDPRESARPAPDGERRAPARQPTFHAGTLRRHGCDSRAGASRSPLASMLTWASSRRRRTKTRASCSSLPGATPSSAGFIVRRSPPLDVPRAVCQAPRTRVRPPRPSATGASGGT